jgi:hypothetical protein
MSRDGAVTIVHPAAEDAAERFGLAPRHGSLAGARIGLIDNSKHMAGSFLEHLGRLLRERHGVAAVEVYRKANPSIPAPPEVLRRLVASCDGVVHGVAD